MIVSVIQLGPHFLLLYGQGIWNVFRISYIVILIIILVKMCFENQAKHGRGVVYNI